MGLIIPDPFNEKFHLNGRSGTVSRAGDKDHDETALGLYPPKYEIRRKT